jgi:hypothetical protein
MSSNCPDVKSAVARRGFTRLNAAKRESSTNSWLFCFVILLTLFKAKYKKTEAPIKKRILRIRIVLTFKINKSALLS